MSMVPAAIEVVGLSRSFGDVVAVDGVDLSIGRGELFSLLGPNGAGKTTTIRMLCCLLRPTSGSALVGGYDTRSDPLAVKRIIAVSPQETAIAEHLTAWENLRLMSRLHGVSKNETRERSARLLEMFGLTARAGGRAKTYSGGMKRRLSIAMALVSSPDILFLDEPTLGLDPQSRRGLWEHIAGLKGEVTILLTTHYLEEADALADRIAVIDAGRVVAMGTTEELKAAVPGGDVTIIEADLDGVAMAALAERFGSVHRHAEGAEVADLDGGLDAVVDVLRPLGVPVRSVYRHQVSLDDVFVHLTGKGVRE